MTGRPPSTGPKRDKLIKVLVTADLLASVTAAARKEGRSVSDWGMRLFEREVAAQATHEPTRRRAKP